MQRLEVSGGSLGVKWLRKAFTVRFFCTVRCLVLMLIVRKLREIFHNVAGGRTKFHGPNAACSYKFIYPRCMCEHGHVLNVIRHVSLDILQKAILIYIKLSACVWGILTLWLRNYFF